MAPDTYTHIQPVTDGELRLSAVHGRLHLTFRSRNARIPVTVALEATAAEHLFTRGLELVQLARAARKQVA